MLTLLIKQVIPTVAFPNTTKTSSINNLILALFRVKFVCNQDWIGDLLDNRKLASLHLVLLISHQIRDSYFKGFQLFKSCLVLLMEIYLRILTAIEVQF